MSGLDEPPPLEDMTEELAKMCRFDGHLPQTKSVTSQTRNCTREYTSEQKSVAEVASESTKMDNEDKGFCGFQKGFLFGPKPSSSSNKKFTSEVHQEQKKNGAPMQTEDDIIRPKLKGNTQELVFTEVQEAMREANPFLETGSTLKGFKFYLFQAFQECHLLNTTLIDRLIKLTTVTLQCMRTEEWLTDDLLHKVEEDPVLSEGLRDPNMMHYLNLLQTNPKQALAASRGNSKLQKFMESFCSLMGNHLSALDEPLSTESPNSEPVIMSEEEAKVKKLTSDPEVKTVLMDPQIVKLMQLLKTDPPAAQRFLVESRTADFDSKIQILLKNGLLSLQ